MNFPAIFLDRDGTLIHEKNYLSQLDQVAFFEDVPLTLKSLKDYGYLLILISNQSGIARGFFPESFVEQTFQHLNQLLKSYEVQLDAHFYCPHHPAAQDPQYAKECNCRKPLPGMILSAQKKFNIDLKQSMMVGDKLCDIALANNLNLRSFLVQTGYGIKSMLEIQQKFPSTIILKQFSDILKHIK